MIVYFLLNLQKLIEMNIKHDMFNFWLFTWLFTSYSILKNSLKWTLNITCSISGSDLQPEMKKPSNQFIITTKLIDFRLEVKIGNWTCAHIESQNELCHFGYDIIGFSETSNARYRLDKWALEVRLIKYLLLHNLCRLGFFLNLSHFFYLLNHPNLIRSKKSKENRTNS